MVFAEQGYDQARVRDIAARAGANVAAINYHFGGKQPLYVAVLRTQAALRIERFPFADPAGLADDVALHAAIVALLSRFLAEDQRGLLPKLLMRELMTPSAVLADVARSLIAPQMQQLSRLVRRVLGARATDEMVLRCTLSIASQCMFYLFARPLVQVLAPHTYDGDPVEHLAAHIAEFSLAALQARRRVLESSDA